MKIVAIIITYGERVEFLKKSLASLLNQERKFDKIFIVDNNSSQETKDFIKTNLSETVEEIKFEKNIVSAAFGKALKIVTQKEEFNWVFFMDDDGELKSDALLKLTQSPAFKSDTSFLTCNRLNLDNKTEQRGKFNFIKLQVDPVSKNDLQKEYIEISHSSFMGMLINKKAIEMTGYSREDFYMYMEDIEYSLRLKKYGPSFLIPSSIVVHKESIQDRSRIINFLGYKIPRTKIKDFWRDYYGFRNLFPLAKEYSFFPLTIFCLFFRLLRTTSTIILFDDFKIRRLKLLWKAAWHGLINKLGQVDLKPSVLFITMGRAEPASRFRVQQFLPYLKQANYKYLVLPLHLGGKSFSASSFLWAPLLIFMKFFSILFVPFYDVVFLQRTVIKRFSPLTEKIIKLFNKNIIFDIDDAIWLNYKKQPNPVAEVMKLSKQVICGNNYLAGYAKKNNSQISVLPTSLDTDKYKAKSKNNQQIIIGWTGTAANLKYLYELKNVLFEKIASEFPQIKLQILCDQEPKQDLGINTKFIPWSSAKEVEVISNFDIGLMPLSDDEWTRGKCSFKALQYMSCEVATVASAVGMNNEVIKHNQNGLLVKNPEDWYLLVKQLIDDDIKRKELGEKGREAVIEKYSVQSNSIKLFKILDSLF